MTTQNPIKDFEAQLARIVGDEMARDLIMFGRAPTPLEATLLKSDGITELTSEQRDAILALITRYNR